MEKKLKRKKQRLLLQQHIHTQQQQLPKLHKFYIENQIPKGNLRATEVQELLTDRKRITHTHNRERKLKIENAKQQSTVGEE